ncbi:hypothetical protein B0E38_01846 [Streptomyces sp. 111WW2]|uniref:hypothetical protein n=1 Tax=Streptomyces sp. 111WW2 TaxID=1945515 RepID=UPI000D0C8A3E|nr:hypothetical protein [Streptomyces sp. 111WW2]PSK58001.1 hypothetical protein B0E38_01846 [Streptomyces sp. 111WW2]
MAMRGTPARSLPGNALGGVLRNLDQRARIAGRTRVSGAPREVDPLPDEALPAAVEGVVGPVGAVLATGEDGRARWAFPAAYGAAPVVMAVAVDPEPGDDERAVFAVLDEVASWYAVVRVWRTRPRRGAGVAEPAGAGVCVHVTATAPAG